MRWLVLVGLVGCYSPTVHPGAPCGAGSACPGELVCSPANTCEAAGGGDTQPIDAPVSGSDAPAGTDACTMCIAPPNDLPGGAIDVTAGGDFTADLTYAHDDADQPAQGNFCGSTGGLDVFYTVTVPSTEMYYLDTFGSDFDTVIRVFHGPCTGGTPPAGTICHNDANSCSSLQTVWLEQMQAGDNCVVVDGADGAQTGHSLHLRVERGHRPGLKITPGGVVGATSYTVAGNTAGAANLEDGSCCQHGAGEIGYAFSLCPGVTRAVRASTCNAVTGPWDTAVWSRGPAGQLACVDDDGSACSPGGGFSTIQFSAADNHLFWVLVDGGSPSVSGTFELDFNFQ